MKKILVAEDEQAIREFVVINLKRAGYDAYEASNGEEALEIYEREKGDFDVAVLDIMMPGKYDGLAVCKTLRQKSGDYTAESIAAAAFGQTGITVFIDKQLSIRRNHSGRIL